MKKLEYVFKLEFKSCAPAGGWVDRSQIATFPNSGKAGPWELGAMVCGQAMKPSETGVRVTYMGLREVGVSNSPTDSGLNGRFTVTLERSAD